MARGNALVGLARPGEELMAPHERVPSSAEHPGLLATVREAVAGSEQDYTDAPIGRAILLLAVPMVLEMVMESVFAIADVFWVSRLGVDAVAAVGLTEAMVTLVYAVAVGMSMATTAMVARRIGEKDPDRAAVAAVQAVILGLAVSLCFAVGGAWGARHLLHLMGGSAELVAQGSGYTAWLFGGSSTIMLLFLINAVLRGAGDAASAMRALWLANGINLVLDPCLIFGVGPFPAMGLTGAAVATTIGRGIGVSYQLWILTVRGRRLRVHRRHLRLDRRVIARLARVSVGGILQFLIGTSSWVALVRVVGSFGSAAVAGYTIAIRVVIFTILPSWGLCNAAATLVGQNLGAGRPDRAETSVWRAGRYNAAFLLAVAAVFIVGAERIVGLFSADRLVLAYGADCLRLVSYGYGFYAYGMVMVQAFNGAGDTRTPSIINFFCYWLFQIPFAYALAHLGGLDARGVFIAITVAESLIAVVGVLVFRRGAWKQSTI
jgi:putative MATE family efflux protein